jgi:hypothetical protein
MLDTERPLVAEDSDGDGHDKSGAEGKLVFESLRGSVGPSAKRKRKQPSTHGAGPEQQRKRRLQPPTSYSRARLDGAAGDSEHNTKGRLPSPVPSIAHTADAEMSSSRSDLDQSLKRWPASPD